MEKAIMYRVELFNDHAKVKGMQSDFAKHTSLENARRWAIERGKKGEAEYVRLYEKSQYQYNHYLYKAELHV